MQKQKFCVHCGSEISEDAKFCPVCGATVSLQDPATDEPSSEKGNPNKRYLRLILIICIVGAAVVVGLLIWGIHRNSRQGADETETEETAAQGMVEEEAAATPAEKVAAMSREQIKQDATDLYNQLIECSVSDPERFKELYVGASDENIQSELEYFSSLELEPDAQQIATIVIESAPSIAIQMENYDLEDGFHDSSDDIIMTYTEEGWKKDMSEETGSTVFSHENMESVYPDAYMQAKDDGRNVYEFDGCFLYLDETVTFEGESILKLAFLSQDEEGCLDAYVWAGNGTAESVDIDELAVHVSDVNLGTVLDQTVSCDKTIGPGTSELIHLYFYDPEDVLTGSQPWTDLEASVSTEIEENEESAQVEATQSETAQSNSAQNDSAQNNPAQSNAGQTASSGATVDIALPDINAEVQYDIDAYCKALRDEYADQNLTTTILFEDGNLVFIGVTYNDKDTGEERKGCVSVPKSSAYTDKTINDYLCSKCSGTGVVTETVTERQTCPICGGTGQQYIPNATYDTIMGWQGAYISCSGCAGAGYIEYESQQYVTCDKCNGFTVSK